METHEFVSAVNARHAGKGLPLLDNRDLPALHDCGLTGAQPSPRDVDSPGLVDFLRRKQDRLVCLEKERLCASCGKKFVAAVQPDLYLYSELVVPPPDNYCPACLSRILEQLASRDGAENMRCCR